MDVTTALIVSQTLSFVWLVAETLLPELNTVAANSVVQLLIGYIYKPRSSAS
jgi:hypothetical protein